MGKRLTKLKELGDDFVSKSIVFQSPDYDDAIIGYDAIDGRVVYNFDKMVEYLMESDGIDEDDAIEFINYNTIGTIPHIGDKAPIVLISIEKEF